MTLLEIYTMIAGLVYGDAVSAPPPSHEVTTMQTLILARHRSCQIGYNFWFQKVETTQSIISGTTDYTWPATFKELIELSGVDYELTATGFKLTETPAEDKTVDFKYWSILATPASWNGSYTDSVTVYLAWMIIYLVTGDMFLKRGEKTDAQAYYVLAEDAKHNAENEDFHRRQSQETTF